MTKAERAKMGRRLVRRLENMKKTAVMNPGEILGLAVREVDRAVRAERKAWQSAREDSRQRGRARLVSVLRNYTDNDGALYRTYEQIADEFFQ